jgi:hypothetical protein
MDTTTVDVATAVQNDARQAYRQSVDAGAPLTGRELGEMFNRGERWGRARITEVRTADAARHNGNGQVNEPEPTGVASGAARTRETAQDGMPGRFWQPPGARLVAWSGFLLGVAASVAANVAHAQPGIGPRIAGAFVPLALLLAVECMTRPRWNRRPGTWSTWGWGLARYGGTGLVALVAAVMSYRHMSALLTGYGEDALNAAIGPLAVDGLMVVAGFALLAMSNPHADKENDS